MDYFPVVILTLFQSTFSTSAGYFTVLIANDNSQIPSKVVLRCPVLHSSVFHVANRVTLAHTLPLRAQVGLETILGDSIEFTKQNVFINC